MKNIWAIVKQQKDSEFGTNACRTGKESICQKGRKALQSNGEAEGVKDVHGNCRKR